jgi:hypothetical protein
MYFKTSFNLEGVAKKVHKFCTTFFKNWVRSVACTINVYDRRFYDRILGSSLERKLRLYDRNPS